MDDDFTWLHHPDTDGYFRCPSAAVKAWVGRGWEVTAEPPSEPDRTRDEPMLAALQEALAAEQAPPPPSDAEKPPAKSSRRTAATEEKE